MNWNMRLQLKALATAFLFVPSALALAGCQKPPEKQVACYSIMKGDSTTVSLLLNQCTGETWSLETHRVNSSPILLWVPMQRGRMRTPRTGDIVDGYEFKGGDPSKKENWQAKP